MINTLCGSLSPLSSLVVSYALSGHKDGCTYENICKMFLKFNTVFCLFEDIDEAQTGFGRTEIIPVVVFYFTTTFATGIFVVIQISITDSDRCLYAKALIQYPMIPV